MARSPARLWLMILGWTLLAIAILGLFDSVVETFHALTVHLEGGENALHWILAVATLAIAYAWKDEHQLATIALWYGVVYVVLGIFGFMVYDLGPWHVSVGDNLLHLAIGIATVATGWYTRDRVEQGEIRRVGT